MEKKEKLIPGIVIDTSNGKVTMTADQVLDELSNYVNEMGNKLTQVTVAWNKASGVEKAELRKVKNQIQEVYENAADTLEALSNNIEMVTNASNEYGQYETAKDAALAKRNELIEKIEAERNAKVTANSELIKKIREQFEKELAAIDEKLNTLVAKINSKYDTIRKNAENTLNKEIENAKKVKADAIALAERNYNMAVNNAQSKYSKAVEKSNADEATEITNAKNDAENRKTAAQAKFDDLHSSEINLLEAQIRDYNEKSDADKDAANNTYNRIEKDYDNKARASQKIITKTLQNAAKIISEKNQEEESDK